MIYNYATNRSFEKASDDEHTMGINLTTYKESTIFRIIFLLKSIADKYGIDYSVQQLKQLVCPFDLVLIACTCIDWTNESFPKENVSLEM